MKWLELIRGDILEEVVLELVPVEESMGGREKGAPASEQVQGLYEAGHWGLSRCSGLWSPCFLSLCLSPFPQPLISAC